MVIGCHYKRLILVAIVGILLVLIGQNVCGTPPCIVTGLDKTFGGPLDDEGYSIQQTSDGGYVFIGRTASYGAGDYDLFLTRTDQDGNKIWERTYGGLKCDEGHSVKQTADGGYILTGKTRSYGSGMNDVWLVKTDQDGNKIWDTTFGGRFDDEGHSVEPTADGGYILTGKTGSYGSGMNDVWMIKADQNGNKVWDRAFGGPSDDEGDSIRQTSDGGYIIAGTTGSFGAGGPDAWLIKTDQNGNKIWDKTFGGPKSELNPWSNGWSVQETDDGEYLLVGSTNSFGSGGYDAWFISTDLNGNLINDKTFGGLFDDEGDSVVQVGDGEYILVGSTSSNGSGGYDAWLIKTDRSGNKIWDQTFGGKFDDKGYSIQKTSDDGYIFVGKTKSYNAPTPKTKGLCEGFCEINRPGIISNFDIWLVKIKSGSPTINVQPASIITCEGQEVTFTVEATGTAPLEYQWKKDGSEIIGGTTNTYSIPGVSKEDEGGYSVVVRNACGWIESETATLKVSSRPSILVQPLSQEVSEGSAATFSVEAGGTEPLFYQWKKNGENITGANTNTYHISSVNENNAGSYSVIVINACGWVESETATLTVHLMPLIQVQPVYEEVCEGSEVSLNVEATGTEPLIYQWKKNGENITGANSKTYYIPSASTSDAGSYSVVVRNCCGIVESNIANLTVNPKPTIQVQPTGQIACEGSVVSFSVEATGTEPLFYQWMKNDENITGATESIYSIPAVSMSDEGDYSVIVSSYYCGWVRSKPVSLILRTKPSILVQPASECICEGSEVSFAVEATGTEPLDYQWMKDGAEISGATSNFYSIPNVSINDAGGYSVVVSNCCGLAISDIAVLTVGIKPSILAQPVSQATCEGTSVTFSVEASGTEPLAYQWMKDGLQIPNATSNSYSIPGVTANDSGNYAVMVSNTCGQIESDTATLTLNVRPAILVQPVSQTVCEGTPVTFSIEASGTEPLAYQWMKDGMEISNARSNSYTIPGATANDIGSYAVIVSNVCGQIQSEAAVLTINFPPSIVVQPVSQTVCEGAPVEFAVEAIGTEPLSYQWTKDGTEIPGANSSSYAIPMTTTSDMGSYAVTISNGCGQTQSEAAALTINVMPSILAQPISQTICEGAPIAFSVDASGTGPLAYQWIKDGSEIYGANADSYNITSATTNDSGSYAVIVSNSCGQIQSEAAALTINVKPSILVQPVSQTVCEGAPVEFSVEATGTEPIVYQWMKDGLEIYGANASTYSIPAVTTNDSGSYAVIVSNTCGQIQSESAALAINIAPSIVVQPISQTACEGVPVTFGVEASGTEPLAYQWMKDGVEIAGASSNSYSIPSATTNDSGSYSVIVSNACGQIQSEAAALTINVAPSILVQPVSQAVCEGAPITFGVEASGTEPLAYQWTKDGSEIYGANASTYSIPAVTTNDSGSYAVIVSNICGQIQSESATLTINIAPSIIVQPVSQTVCEGAPVTFAVEAAGTGPMAYQWMKDGTQIPGANGDSYNISSAATNDSGSYAVIVSNSCGQTQSEAASLAINVAPSILVQPASQTVCEGAPAIFSVEASGTEPLAYQWLKDGTQIPGANEGSYNISSVTTNDSGSYTVIVSNSCGQIQSGAVALTINVKPSILVQPASQTACEGSSVTFSVEATGTEPLAYQWMKDGSEITNASSNSYNIPSVTTSDSGSYTVTVSNGCGQIQSEATTLTINFPPSIVVQPVSQMVCEGTPVEFAVEASGTEPMAYQWTKDGSEIPGANVSTYSIPSVITNDSGSYAVIVSNTCGQIQSEAAALTINIAPSIVVQPASQTVCEGTPVTFGVEASGTEPLAYQWMKDGAQLANATSNSYTIPSVTANDSGSYAVVISNGCGQIQSEGAALTINIAPSILVQPVSQAVCEGAPVIFSAEASGTEPLAYQWMKDGTQIPGANEDSYSISSITTNDSGSYSVIVSNICGQVQSEAATLTINVAPSIMIQPVSQTVCEGAPVAFAVEASGTEPLTYQWMKDGSEIYEANEDSYNITSATTNDSGGYAVIVSNSCGQIKSDVVALNINVAPLILIQPVSQAVCEGTPAIFSVEVTGTEPLAYQWMKDGVEIAGASSNSYSIPSATTNDSGSYSVIVSNACGQIESEAASLAINVAPSILTQPASQTTCEGSQVMFSVEAAGTEPLAHQWMKDGTQILGANEDSYNISSVTTNDSGSYSVIVSNSCGQIESDAANLVINVAPSIVVQPVSQTVCEGAPALFSVEVSGTEPLSYQWTKDGTEILGANSSSYAIPMTTTGDMGSYGVMVSNSCGQTQSEAATLTISVKPSILVQPVSQTTCEGSQVTFIAEASGTEQLAYQWMKDGAEIQGANTASYMIPNVNINDAGGYSLIVNNCCGLAISDVAVLTVGTKPSILVQPVSQTTCEGASVTFSVEARGSEPLAYQWMKDDLQISDATSNSYSIPGVTANDSGNYAVMVSNNCGQTESDMATLTMNIKPSILVQPVSQIVCEGSPVTFAVEATGTEPLAYQWTKDGLEIAGASSSSYSISNATTNDLGSYAVMVNNSCGQIQSEAATLTINVGPSILAQPVSQTVCEGIPVSFAVEAAGTEPLAYQWMKDGAQIPGANEDSYIIPSATTGDSGSYAAIVSNSCGQVESEAATLTINVGPSILVQPASQTACEGSQVTFSVEASGDEPLAYQWMKDGAEIAGANSNTYSIPCITADDSGSYAVVVSNNCGQTESEAAALTINVKPSILVQPISQIVCEGSQVTFSVEAAGTEPLSYQWAKDGSEIPGANEDSYNIPCATTNDMGCYSVTVSNSCGQVESDTATLHVGSKPEIKDQSVMRTAIMRAPTTIETQPSITIHPLSQSVCEGSAVTFSAECENEDARSEDVRSMHYQWMKDDEIIPGANSKRYMIFDATPDQAGEYKVVVSNRDGSIESNSVTLSVTKPPMFVIVQPSCLVTSPGKSATFKVTARGGEPLSYQWVKDGLEIPGANSDIYTIQNVDMRDAGYYGVVVSNSCCSTESNIAVLKVRDATTRYVCCE